MEDYLFEKIDKKKPNRLSNLEWLGQDMISAGNVFGPSTSYGNNLVGCAKNCVASSLIKSGVIVSCR